MTSRFSSLSITVLTLLLLDACSDSPSKEPEDGSIPDAYIDANEGSTPTNPLLVKLQGSRTAWDMAVAEHADTYGYEEENCVANSTTGTITTVQVVDGDARLVATRSISRDECEGSTNRLEDFTARTLPELYDECASLLERSSATEIELDDMGIVRSCSLETPPPECQGACGEGFYVRTWTFGELPAQ